MTYSTCNCGEYQHWGSGVPPPACVACDTCGVTPYREPPVPHDFSRTQTVETDEGDATLTRCRHCLKTKAQIERRAKR